jgi:hypothetical protein
MEWSRIESLDKETKEDITDEYSSDEDIDDGYEDILFF